jgi:[acyl-carrier-protein] S-malonyltransferase
MEPAREKLQKAIEETQFSSPICPVYQNVSTTAVSNVDVIKSNLIMQLTAPVKWTQSVQNMVKDGATQFIECGPGKVLQGLVKKIHSEAEVSSI